jgi:hypothetical protein
MAARSAIRGLRDGGSLHRFQISEQEFLYCKWLVGVILIRNVLLSTLLH